MNSREELAAASQELDNGTFIKSKKEKKQDSGEDTSFFDEITGD
jgi:hypothetical protein